MDMKKLGMLALGAGALYMIIKKGGPTFYNVNGQAITEVVCGNSIAFDVPGYPRVWMSQLKNGQLNYDGPFNLPMPTYVVSCSNDVGTYEIAVYEINENDVKGALIGQTSFNILPQA